MPNAARKIELVLDNVSQGIGHVLDLEGGALRVRTTAGEYDAKRAVSCLVGPIAGDVVLVAFAPNGEAYVLAVLERDSGAKTTIDIDGDLEVRTRTGGVVIATPQGIDLVSGTAVSVVAGEVRVNAVEGSVAMQRLSFFGALVRAEIEKVKLFADTLDSVVERLSLKVKRSFRTIEEVDQLRAERIDYTAKSTMSLHAENALVTAEQLVKVDGEQIHLG